MPYLRRCLFSTQGFATRGVGAICMEATAVVPEGRISPEDAVGFRCSLFNVCLLILGGYRDYGRIRRLNLCTEL